MAGTSGFSPEFKEVKLSDESEYFTLPASEGDHVTTPSSFLSAVGEQIEKSKSHWSELTDQSGCMEEGEDSHEAEVSNVEEFLELQRHPTWGDFFITFGYRTEILPSLGELVVGTKFAEGGQAELFHAHVTWRNPKIIEQDLKDRREYVLKVFKKGTFLKHLKSQLPQGLLEVHAWQMQNPKIALVSPRYFSHVHGGTLLKDGRFAFLMEKEHFDLRTLIERNMKSKSGEECRPFSKEEVEHIMFQVALGVDWLHSRDIIHRDLKASNVLVKEFKTGYPKLVIFVADYECSVGVVGTGFFRAPEILQVCKERKSSQVHEVFSRAADVYAYGMTCYEILTGKLPFEDHPLSKDNPLLIDLVINQHLRLEIPEYVEDWTCELLSRCWHPDSTKRPSIAEILDVLLENSVEVRKCDESLKEAFGGDFRTLHQTSLPQT